MVDVQINIKSKIILLIDGLEAISVKECTQVSRGIAAWLEEQDFIKETYTLEVSTAGAEAELKNPLQFRKHIGREVKVCLKEGENFQGILKGISNEVLILEVSKKEKGMKMKTFESLQKISNIQSITVVISFKEK